MRNRAGAVIVALSVMLGIGGGTFAVPTDTSDVAMAGHRRRCVKTNYHPPGTARRGAGGERMAVLDSHLRVLGIDR